MNNDEFVTEWPSGEPETPCGKGSMLAETKIIRRILPEYVEAWGIKTINDIGCGDQNWINEIKWPWEVEIKSFDIRPRYSDVTPFDVTREVAPKADLILCIYVLNHLKPRQKERAYRLLKESESEYLLTTFNEYDKVPYPFMREREDHKETGRHKWAYGLWDLQDEE